MIYGGTYILEAPEMFRGFTGGVSLPFPFPFAPKDIGLPALSMGLVFVADFAPAPFDPLAPLPLAV